MQCEATMNVGKRTERPCQREAEYVFNEMNLCSFHYKSFKRYWERWESEREEREKSYREALERSHTRPLREEAIMHHLQALGYAVTQKDIRENDTGKRTTIPTYVLNDLISRLDKLLHLY